VRVESKGLSELIERFKARTERTEHLQPALEFIGESFVKQTDDCFANSVDWDGKAFAPLADSTIEQRATRTAGGRGGTRAARREKRAQLKAQGKSRKDITRAIRRMRASYQRNRRIAVEGLTAAEKKKALARLRDQYAARNDALRESGLGRSELARELKKSQRAYKRKRDKIIAPSGIRILVDTARARNSNHADKPQETYFLWSAVGYLAYHMAGTAKMEARNPTPFVYARGEWTLHPRAAEQMDQAVVNYIIRGEPDRGAA
jgi:hypothetical protein